MDETWKSCAERDFVAGTFLWTGFDYRGETYPFDWPAAIRLSSEMEGTFVCKIEVVDANGHIVPSASNNMKLRVAGEGQIIGVGNGNPTSHEPPKGKEIKAFHGLAQVIVQANGNDGKIILTAESEGLKSAVLEFSGKPRILIPSIEGILAEVKKEETSANPVDGIL